MDKKPPSFKQHSVLSQGRIATALLDQLEPYLKKRENALVQSMKNAYLTSTANELFLMSATASLCEIEALRKELCKDIKHKEHIEKELFNG